MSSTAAPPETAPRTVFLLAHTGRPAAVRSAELVVQGLLRAGLGVRVLEAEAVDLPLPSSVEKVPEACSEAIDDCELLVVLGGDGTRAVLRDRRVRALMVMFWVPP
ncbi:hypothetical protein ABZ054_30320, partial [Streptomyces sp. NPDC006324]